MKFLGKMLLIIIMIVLSSIFVFADSAKMDYDLDDYLEIINPSFDETGDIIVKNNLFLSMNIKQDAKLFLTLKKYMPIMDEVYFEKIMNDEIDRTEFIENIANRVLEINMNSDELLEEKIIPVIDRYINSYILKNEFELKFVNSSKVTSVSDENDLTVNEEYDLLKNEYLDVLDEFNESKNAYVELFKIKIIDRDLIEPLKIMPYYEKTIENIAPAKYELSIELEKEENEIYLLNKTNFNVKIKPKEILVESDIELIQPEITESMELVQPTVDIYGLEE